jgi:hypothetical protein
MIKFRKDFDDTLQMKSLNAGSERVAKWQVRGI